ncbi:DNA processing protein DprA [Massilia sp. Root418]|uniref:DNA-processing protein DprA n=1 Tax=Massilia sp. Root418 TaxID=1736532 RepID=UPI0006F5CF1F|nr:DNA-processing protein DprA [Massilia sp. Root418]KQW91380.1 DNA processing protein DprA [Massilia sp. Root418]
MQATDTPAPAPQPVGRAALASWLRLQLTPGVGVTAGAALIAELRHPDRVFDAGPDRLGGILSEVLADSLVPAAVQALRAPSAALLDEAARLADAALGWLAQPGHQLMALDDPAFPPLLREIPAAPLLLYTRGRRELLYRPAVAIVGSRNASAQGVANADRFAEALAAAGLTVVSGLALGIDAAAHAGGLAGGGGQGGAGTVAVVGTGIDRLYPARNRELALRIAAEGCVVSEYPLGTAPLPDNFPRRNRIISGLARGVLVIEAAAQSGSLITARYALNQGRDVFAVPGSIHATLSKGCNALIREGKAKLTECAADVLVDLLPEAPSGAGAERLQATAQVRAELEAVLSALGHDPAHADTLARRAGLSAADAQSHLLALELAGLVERLPGGIFQRLSRAAR